MDKETLSNYGWIVICVMVLAVMLAFASPFGNFVAEAIKSTTQGLFDVNQGALDSAGIEIMQQEFETMLNGTTKSECPIRFGEQYSMNDTEDAIIYVFYEDGSIDFTWLYWGEILISDTMPAGTCGYDGLNLTGIDEETGETIVVGTVSADGTQIDMGEGGILVLGSPCLHPNKEIVALDSESGTLRCSDCNCDIRTVYKCPDDGIYYVDVSDKSSTDYTTATAVYQAGEYIMTPPSYDDVYLSGDYKYTYTGSGWKAEINTLVKDKNQQSYGEITRKNINGKFVTSLAYTFQGCSQLTTVPSIPDTVTDMKCTFYQCRILKTAPLMPSGVTNMTYTFYGCYALETYIGSKDGIGDFSDYVIPSEVTSMSGTFKYCYLLTYAPQLPEKVQLMNGTFGDTALITAPTIPSSVENLAGTFENCKSLTGTVVINTNKIPTSEYNLGTNTCYECFKNVDMTNITLTGTATRDFLNLVGATGNNWTPIE